MAYCVPEQQQGSMLGRSQGMKRQVPAKPQAGGTQVLKVRTWMDRDHLTGRQGDGANAILAAAE
jgi:hypothetical protein